MKGFRAVCQVDLRVETNLRSLSVDKAIDMALVLIWSPICVFSQEQGKVENLSILRG